MAGKHEQLSAFDNIAIGTGEPTVSLQSVIESAKLVGIHSKIRTWKSYYSSRLGDDPDSDSDHSDSSDDDDDDDDASKEARPEDPPVPFMAKVLQYNLHHKNRVRGKDLKFWPAPKTTSLTHVPEWDDAMDAEDQYFHTEWLSGGQWQKVAMARAFMKIREAELLILDEPSSALDPQAEYELFKTLMELRRGKTTIFIV